MTLLHDHAYWRGVRVEVGARDTWEALRACAVTEPPDCVERDCDLAGGFDRLAALLAAEPVDALRLRWRDTPIGRIAPLPAAEPLRPVHVRAALLESFASTLVRFVAADAPPWPPRDPPATAPGSPPRLTRVESNH